MLRKLRKLTHRYTHALNHKYMQIQFIKASLKYNLKQQLHKIQIIQNTKYKNTFVCINFQTVRGFTQSDN